MVWQRQLPALQYCKQNVYPIGHTVQLGDTKSHTVWVSIVPVTFSKTLAVDLNLSWFWNLCTDNLSASIGIQPVAGIALEVHRCVCVCVCVCVRLSLCVLCELTMLHVWLGVVLSSSTQWDECCCGFCALCGPSAPSAVIITAPFCESCTFSVD